MQHRESENEQLNEPGYLSLYRGGELQKRTEALEARLADCDICPRACHINRLRGEEGFCHSGIQPVVASLCAHRGEEPPLSGTRGSGTIFFGNCNLRCVYCQNYQISQDWVMQKANEVDCRALAEKMLYLQGSGCHNINLVSPSHFVPQILRALVMAIPLGLKLPLVYNTGGYDSLATIRQLDGVIDIYLPDIRYASDEHARRFSQAPDYVSHNRAAIKEMYRQVGNIKLDDEGIAYKGLVVRHLILPNRLAGSEESLTWLASEVSPGVAISLMSQYFPSHRASQMPLLWRTISYAEYQEVVAVLERLEMDNGWLQEMGASAHYVPDFNREGHPFEPSTGTG